MWAQADECRDSWAQATAPELPTKTLVSVCGLPLAELTAGQSRLSRPGSFAQPAPDRLALGRPHGLLVPPRPPLQAVVSLAPCAAEPRPLRRRRRPRRALQPSFRLRRR